jgi:acyl-coenzyme A thioesterase PaaI-like protein
MKGVEIKAVRGQNTFSFESMATIQFKSRSLGTAHEGTIACVAARLHSGRTTQVWDAQVTDETSGKTIALFRCTQLILYPRPS